MDSIINRLSKLSLDDKDDSLSNACTELMKKVCNDIWPVLAVVGGVNPGFRLGGECDMDKGRKGLITGLPEQKSVKVQEISEGGKNSSEQK